MMKMLKKLEVFSRDRIAFIKEVARRYSQGQGHVYSAYLAYYFLVSIFPFILAILAIMSFIPFGVDEALSKLIEFFPSEVHGGLKSFIESNKRNSNLIGYSVFFLLWSSAKATGSIRKALNCVSGVQCNQNFIKTRVLDSIRNVFFIFSILLILFIPTAVKLTKLGSLLFLSRIPYFFRVIEYMQWLFIFALLFGLISFVYMRMGTKKYSFNEVKYGGLLVSLAWVFLSFLFNGVMSLSNNLVYGAFNVVIALLVWFQINMTVFLVGANLNEVLNENKTDSN